MANPDRKISVSEDLPEAWLSEEELVGHAGRLIDDFKRALSENPAFGRAMAEWSFRDPDILREVALHFWSGQAGFAEVKFIHQASEYSVDYTVNSHGRNLRISRFYEGEGSESIILEALYKVGNDRGTVLWEHSGEEGEKPWLVGNTQTAVEKVEAFLEQLKGTA